MYTVRFQVRFLAGLFLLLPLFALSVRAGGFASRDHLRLRSVAEVRFSPDGKLIAYVVNRVDAAGHPESQIWITNPADGKSQRLGGENGTGTAPQWSRDSQWIAYESKQGDKSALMIARRDGSEIRSLADLRWTNSPLPSIGHRVTWSPDGRRIAFASAVPGPETADASGDPVVITRYLYKPDLAEGFTRFNDNRRTHIFVADLESGQVQQLTEGDYYEHSIDWSPNGGEILFVSNREPNADQFFNYDIFALRVSDRGIRRLTATESAEYRPRWSPDGRTIAFQATRRGLTDLETTMEDTHVWLMNADGSNRREWTAMVDNRQGPPAWSPDGQWVYFSVQERGNIRLYRMPAGGTKPEVVVNAPGTVGAYSPGPNGSVAYVLTSPSDTAQLYLKTAASEARKLTRLNAEVLADKQVAEVEPFTFTSNDNKYEIQAFLTKPLSLEPGSKHPLIVSIHGGPHNQQGPAFNLKNQVYASRGWAVLNVNYRGSTGYGQKFADAIFRDQNGNEAQDVLYGLSAAMRRYLWIDRDRLGIEGGSYGGQLTNWLITQTGIFKAAIPIASISNLISYNYMTYYNQYEQMEWGVLPHQDDLMDVLWQRSALRRVAQVRTPTMLVHGENDNDVPIAEAEQFYIALRDVGVEAIMVRYPREGHGVREPNHVADLIDRSIAWYEKHFPVATR